MNTVEIFSVVPDRPVADEETHTRLLGDQHKTSIGLLPPNTNGDVSEKEDEWAPLLSPGGVEQDIPFADDNQSGVFQTANCPESKEDKVNKYAESKHSHIDNHLSTSTSAGVTHPSQRFLSGPQQSQTDACPGKRKHDFINPKVKESCSVPADLKMYGSIQIVINDCDTDNMNLANSNGGHSKEGKENTVQVLETVNRRKVRRRRWSQLGKYSPTLAPHTKKGKTLMELLKTYRLHIFVCAIFLITTLSVSLSWHFRIMAQEQLYASQAIFFNPRTREITLADPRSRASLRGHLGLDIPSWILPLHCPIVSSGDPDYKECLWKNEAELKIVHLKGQDVQCYNISWASLGPRYAPHDCFYIHKDKWYGPTNQSKNSFPIEGEFYFQPKKNYTLSNNGVFNNVVDFYWLSSGGAAIYINADSPIQVAWNESGDNQLCMRSNFSGPLYHKTNSYDYPDMNYLLCNGVDSLTTHIYMQTILASPNGLKYPSNQILRGTHWSMKNCAANSNFTQDQVLSLLDNITEYGFPDNYITLDGDWQKAQGDMAFNAQNFQNVSEILQSKDARLTLSVSPYFQYTSGNFHEGIASSVFVKDAGGEVTGLTKFQGGLAAILDVFTEGGTQWYSQKLQAVGSSPLMDMRCDFEAKVDPSYDVQALCKEPVTGMATKRCGKNITAMYGIQSYRLSYGDQAWLPYKPHFSDIDATPNKYRRVVTESLASMPGLSFVVEHTSDSRHVTSLIPVVSEFGNVQGTVCITNLIETALTLGLMGYPFLMADGIRIKSETRQDQPLADARPSRELYIRWVQLAICFPAYQFSIVPWEYDLDVVVIARNLTVLRQKFILDEIMDKDVQGEVGKGYPIIRPVWWLDPDNITVHDMKIKDEFLIGNNFLVAPVLCENITQRDIYVPPGVWEDVHLGTLILGPNILKSYAVSLDTIPMFMRRKVVGDTSQSDTFSATKN